MPLMMWNGERKMYIPGQGIVDAETTVTIRKRVRDEEVERELFNGNRADLTIRGTPWSIRLWCDCEGILGGHVQYDGKDLTPADTTGLSVTEYGCVRNPDALPDEDDTWFSDGVHLVATCRKLLLDLVERDERAVQNTIADMTPASED